MEVKLIHDYANVYFLEINGVKIAQELHYHEAELIRDYLDTNREVIREAVWRK